VVAWLFPLLLVFVSPTNVSSWKTLWAPVPAVLVAADIQIGPYASIGLILCSCLHRQAFWTYSVCCRRSYLACIRNITQNQNRLSPNRIMWIPFLT